MTLTTSDPLTYYITYGAALFPIPKGQKNPVGIVASFALDWSRDPAQWTAWREANPDCNFGLIAGPSRLIIVDTDAKKDRNAAWAARCELFAQWGVSSDAMPHVQSARGGWHDLFMVPDDIDAASLRQPDAIKGVVNVRAGNGFVVAAGSFYDGTAKGESSGPYILLSDAPPHPAPAALIAHCTRAARPLPVTKPGERDAKDVAAVVTWLAERDAFSAYEDWCQIGMALKLEYGDDGLALWQLAHDETVNSDVEATKWASFAADPQPGCITLNSFLDRAHKLGWTGTVRKSTAAMFDGAATVAALAQQAGANLHGAGMPMLGGQEALAAIGKPILAEFMTATSDAPNRPLDPNFPTLPDACSGHGLFQPLRDAIGRILAMGGTPKTFRTGRCDSALAILSLVHAETFDSVTLRLEMSGCVIHRSKIKRIANAISELVERAGMPQDDWIIDIRSGEPQNDNPDNLPVFLGIIGCELRWNAWLERAEIQGGNDPNLSWPQWTYIDDTVSAKLRSRAFRTKTRWRVGKDFFWDALLALAHRNTVDPVCDLLTSLESSWDGVPRLAVWLSHVCHVPADPYHQAVGKNIIGGMVRRARKPGCKHDTMAIFFGPQGTGKSTMAEILSISKDWFTDTILLGDASKELVLSLAGKLVVEIGEMGMRGSTNPNHVKAMISRTVDAGRTAYARAVTERMRRNIFLGTANEDEPLQDPTGNRRFLPVRCERELDLYWLQWNIRQLVAEACVLETAGADFALPRDVWADAAERQEAARAESDMEIALNDWFAETEHSRVAFVTAADLVALSSVAGFRSVAGRGAIMKRLGFRSDNVLLGGKRSRIWARGDRAVRAGVRYVIGVDVHGRATVNIRQEAV